MSTGRVLWIIYCSAWSAVWVAAAVVVWPRRVCAEYLLVNPQCMAWRTTGGVGWVALFVLLAGLSVAAIALPVGRPAQSRLHDYAAK